MGGVGGISSMTKDEWMVLVPRADGKMQAVRCYSMNQVTCVFPTFQLTEAVEAVKADAPENDCDSSATFWEHSPGKSR